MNEYLKIIESSFSDSKYKKWYIELCNKALQREDIISNKEKHHILPKSMCSNSSQKRDKMNLVPLTPREHYIAHLLLLKITNDLRMAYAIKCFNDMRVDVKVNARLYESIKIEQSRFISESAKERIKRNGHPRQGVQLSEETKNKISKSLTGFKMSDEAKQNISSGLKERYKNVDHHNKGKIYSDEYKSKMSISCKKVKKTDEWNKKNSLSNTGRIHIANVVTKERRRPYKEDAEQLLNMENSDWIKLASMKPIPDKKED